MVRYNWKKQDSHKKYKMMQTVSEVDVVQHFGVWNGTLISKKIAAGLFACGIPFVQIKELEQWQAKNALLILPPDVGPLPGIPQQVRYLLLPDGMQPVIRADCAVSYGLSGRDSITVSSLGENTMAISLQRELVTVSGHVLERQELLLPQISDLSAEETLAVYGALLLLDAAPSDLTKCRLE